VKLGMNREGGELVKDAMSDVLDVMRVAWRAVRGPAQGELGMVWREEMRLRG